MSTKNHSKSEVACLRCGDKFMAYSRSLRRGLSKYCTAQCYYKSDRKRVPETAESIRNRFWSSVEKSDGCWTWKACQKDSRGYGAFTYHGKTVLAHRHSWEIHFGEIPDKMLVCHKCDNPSCVRPDHFFLGTCKDNNSDRAKKGRNSDQRRYANETVSSVKRMSREGMTQAAIMAATGIPQPTIHRMLHKKEWSHIE